LAPGATLDSILEAATAYLPPRSAQIMREAIGAALALARECGDYAPFRARYYAEHLLPGTNQADSRETTPVALALFWLARGDPRTTVIYGANFGRDADTIASMAGALAGAWRGASAFPPEWVEKVKASSPRDHHRAAADLVQVIQRRAEIQAQRAAAVLSRAE